MLTSEVVQTLHSILHLSRKIADAGFVDGVRLAEAGCLLVAPCDRAAVIELRIVERDHRPIGDPMGFTSVVRRWYNFYYATNLVDGVSCTLVRAGVNAHRYDRAVSTHDHTPKPIAVEDKPTTRSGATPEHLPSVLFLFTGCDVASLT